MMAAKPGNISAKPRLIKPERLCFEKHLPEAYPQIKRAGHSGRLFPFLFVYQKGTDTEKGTQIDLLIDRNDKVINLFEIKFYNAQLSISADYARLCAKKYASFRKTTNTRKHIMLTLITTFGLKVPINIAWGWWIRFWSLMIC